jgi:hypothetical protein
MTDMDPVEIIAVSIVGVIVGGIVITGITIACLKRRADVAIAAADLEAAVPPVQNNTMPHPPSVEDMTYIRYA